MYLAESQVYTESSVGDGLLASSPVARSRKNCFGGSQPSIRAAVDEYIEKKAVSVAVVGSTTVDDVDSLRQ